MSLNGDRPHLCVFPLEQAVTKLAWTFLEEASGAMPKAYRLAGVPVITVPLDGVTITKPVTSDEFRAILDHHICCFRPGKKHGDPHLCYPPPDLVKMMLHDPESPLPVLRRIVSVPVFSQAGRLRLREGYSPDDGLLLVPEVDTLPVSPMPAARDVEAAKRLLLDEVLVDFPFASDGDRAASVALLLLPFIRDLIAGPTPLHFIEAPSPGSGKGLLASVCLAPGLGVRGVNWIAFPEEDDELRKQITTLLMENRGAVLWDNLGRFLRSATLAKLLTDLEWSDRRLGVSSSVAIPVRTIWVMTGNNPQMSDELIRRVVPIRLVPQEERPEERRGFRHTELRTWVAAHRADLIWAAHTLVQSWLAAGRPAPPPDTPPLGSFESYRSVVGGILHHVGIPGFLENRTRLQAFSDPDTDRWRQFLTLWYNRFGDAETHAKDLVPLAEEAEISLRGESDKAKTGSLGTHLGQRRQRAYAGYRIESGTGRARRMWRAVAADQTVSQGVTGSGSDSNAGDAFEPELDFSVTPCGTCDTLLPPPHMKQHDPYIRVGASEMGVTGDTGGTDGLMAYPPGLDPHWQPDPSQMEDDA